MLMKEFFTGHDKTKGRYMTSYLPSISIQAKHMAQEVQNELANLERCNEAHKLQLYFVHPEIFF